MKKRIIALLLATASVAALPSASATVLTFDDLGADGTVPAAYGGLEWSAGDWFAFGEAQDPYTAHSGDYRATAGFGDLDDATAIGFTSPSWFQGAWFSGLQGATVTFRMYRAGVLVATSGLLDPGATPQFLASGYGGIVDRIVVSSPAQGSYVMDDFSFTRAVPEPATVALLFAGMGVAVLIGRRRNSTARA